MKRERPADELLSARLRQSEAQAAKQSAMETPQSVHISPLPRSQRRSLSA
jgi:hypothetical protein